MERCVKTLPPEYREVLQIDATNKRLGLLFNGVAFVVLIAVLAVVLPTANYEAFSSVMDNPSLSLLSTGVILAMIVYMVLQEIVHGIAYKALTKEKLTFGLKWSCAFCGVPDVYVSRKTALVALLAPFLTFTLLFLPLTVWFGVTGSVVYIPSGLLLGLHWGGCSGDLYMTWLLLFKYRDHDLLVRDTGPEQFLYQHLKEEENKSETNVERAV